ncbi:bifunctional 5,10-methylene-tetrahydrofolate dehydrogenase/5,10-methylene-tetrahydrofolate cyclohydrolase [Pelagibaculum spongiae]|uniref:Bifunctional protein FolD n=2 Tax=Pelagibaculum spongiae TaxID=2080658 RepID=A0A2V1GWI0_9GAMM|nr:bifunctional 5,10-methylene-tetrahydrofolate dehydrogenase/5,10-methylene-tetrahydrofolate cyclohydrolase [Pelagibaculum spongiae]
MDQKVIDGRAHAAGNLKVISQDVEVLKEQGWNPQLISVMVGDVQEAALYVRNQKRIAEQAGIAFREKRLPESITEAEMQAAIAGLNADPSVSGIILQRPMPAHLNVKALQKAVHPLKDVEGMHPESIGNIVYKEMELGPCTAMAAVEILKSTGLKLEGLEVVVIGHSEIVGKPIAFLLLAEGATVTVCHHMTHNVAVHTRRADVVFVAVGKAGLVTGDMLKPGAAVIDIGINQVVDAQGNSKVVGDADFESCSQVAGWITPVPGGVGPVTVSVLMRNAVTATQRQKAHYESEYSHRFVPAGMSPVGL